MKYRGSTIFRVVSHEDDTKVSLSVGDQCTLNTSRECSFQFFIGNSYRQHLVIHKYRGTREWVYLQCYVEEFNAAVAAGRDELILMDLAPGTIIQSILRIESKAQSPAVSNNPPKNAVHKHASNQPNQHPRQGTTERQRTGGSTNSQR